MPIELRILSGARAGQIVKLEQPIIAIGRDASSDLRFDPQSDLDVSTNHAEVRRSGNGWMLYDRQSRNGTFVNGERVSWGPARGDLFHWRYESVDLAPWLKSGRNTLAAVVWNFGQETPIAQITYEAGFLLQGDTDAERIVDTNAQWKGIRDEAYSAIPVTHGEVRGYYVAGPAERVEAAKYPWGWQTPEYDDSSWGKARAGEVAAPRSSRDAHSRYMLVSRPIPALEQTPRRLSRVRLTEAVTAPASFPGRPADVTVPANTKARLLLDQDFLTSGYPELVVSGGKGSTIRMGYAEALFIPKTRDKGNRNEVAGKEFIGPRG